MQIIVIDQPEVFRQLENGLRCPICGAPMESTVHNKRWFLECLECVTVFGGFSGSAAGGFDTHAELISSFLEARKARGRKR